MNKNYIHTIIYFSIFLWLVNLSSCVTIEKIRTGEQAMDRKQYAVAQQLFEQEIANSKGKNKARKAFLLGEAYRMTNQASNALVWYLNSERFGSEEAVLYWWIAKMYKQSGNYKKASDYFNKISTASSLGIDARRERDICRQALEWEQRGNTTMSVSQIETKGAASIYTSGYYQNKLIVTSDKKSRGNKAYKWTGRYFSDIYLLDPDSPEELDAFPGWKSRNVQQGSPTFNNDRTEMIYTLCSDEIQTENFCKLYSSRYINDQWQEGIILSFIQPGINYSQPFLSRDSILFYSSNDPSGIGAYDIYYAVKTNKGWNKPVNLGYPINTKGNENFPVMYEDTLFFSSDYLPGLGGLDIFKSELTKSGRWNAPQNMMPPVNSSSDDFGYYVNHALDSGDHAYFNSSRNNEKGMDQLFSIRLINPEIVSDGGKEEEEIITAKKYNLYLSLKFFEKVFEDQDDPNSLVIGKKPVGKVSGQIEEGESFTSRDDGRYIRKIEFNTEYLIRISKNGFLQKTIVVPAQQTPGTDIKKENLTYSMEVELSRPYFDQEIVLENIYYDLDQWYIRDDAKPILDQLKQNLLDNPTLKVMIAAHTDCRADDTYNLELSEKRAKSVVEYLVSKGIGQKRLSFRGYGKSRLIEKCPCETCTETQHQKNRRTTFTLLR